VDQPETRELETGPAPNNRRRFLLRAGALGATAALTAAGLAACGGGSEAPEETATVKPKRTVAPRTVPASGAAGGHGASGTAAAAAATAEGHAAEAVAMTPDKALEALIAGNERFVAMKLTHPDTSVARRTEIANGQHPFACIIGCIDSRVPPEVVFDQGLGDLLTSRVGAAIGDDSIIGSTEFGVEEFHIPLVMVLGHERCGAVKATLDAVKAGKSTTAGQIGAVVGPIIPAVKEVLGKGGDELDNAVRAVVKHTVASLKASPVLSELVHQSKVKIVGARYDLDTGKVEVIG
jgi:carbonic anhydrase